MQQLKISQDYNGSETKLIETVSAAKNDVHAPFVQVKHGAVAPWQAQEEETASAAE